MVKSNLIKFIPNEVLIIKLIMGKGSSGNSLVRKIANRNGILRKSPILKHSSKFQTDFLSFGLRIFIRSLYLARSRQKIQNKNVAMPINMFGYYYLNDYNEEIF